ncbi:hypothetical protein EDEG_03929 [Edhazardia aedis USNM 41457]|uniref:Uncharacterized protein n=1 Tax=Edhazardia aedis (strain USNM 41457) TaxID=1003232 RepID=J8ZP54_EDHAE|nr:hypothetical protein EDEG_03929 [Edhazardia aedis USNM 41457]|eukprot:EJW01488.1 hypothetical protein EDEG_03929 [Edhazardia aedis USNM 41457]
MDHFLNKFKTFFDKLNLIKHYEIKNTFFNVPIRKTNIKYYDNMFYLYNYTYKKNISDIFFYVIFSLSDIILDSRTKKNYLKMIELCKFSSKIHNCHKYYTMCFKLNCIFDLQYHLRDRLEGHICRNLNMIYNKSDQNKFLIKFKILLDIRFIIMYDIQFLMLQLMQ